MDHDGKHLNGLKQCYGRLFVGKALRRFREEIHGTLEREKTKERKMGRWRSVHTRNGSQQSVVFGALLCGMLTAVVLQTNYMGAIARLF